MHAVYLVRLNFLNMKNWQEFKIVGKMMEDGVFFWLIGLLIKSAWHKLTFFDYFVERSLVCEHHSTLLAERDGAWEDIGFETFFHIKKKDARVHVVRFWEVVVIEILAVNVQNSGGFEAVKS